MNINNSISSNYSRLLLCLSCLICSLSLSAAELEKSKIKSDRSFLDIEKGIVTYQDNVLYSHANMTIEADKLVREDKVRKLVTLTGSPVSVTHRDLTGAETEVTTQKLVYDEVTGLIQANGSIQLVQRSNTDTLTLKGSSLKANHRALQGFSFVLKGQPTEFHLEQPNKQPISATADQLRSNGKGQNTELLGQVTLRQGTSSMAASHLIYDGANNTISAQQGVNGEQRVETEFFWDKEDSAEQTPPSDGSEQNEN